MSSTRSLSAAVEIAGERGDGSLLCVLTEACPYRAASTELTA
jgi:hypothetical protein